MNPPSPAACLLIGFLHLGGSAGAAVHSLAPAVEVNNASNPQDVLFFDWNGNGKDDILTYPSALGNRIALHRQTSLGYSVEPLAAEPAGCADWSHVHLLRGRFVNDPTSPLQLALLASTFDIFGNRIGNASLYLGNANGLREGPQSQLAAFTKAVVTVFPIWWSPRRRPDPSKFSQTACTLGFRRMKPGPTCRNSAILPPGAIQIMTGFPISSSTRKAPRRTAPPPCPRR